MSFKGCKLEHAELPIHFETFNDECAIVKEAQIKNLLSWGSKLTRVNLQLNWSPSESTIPVLKRILFQYLKITLITTMNFLGHTTSWPDYDPACILRVCEIKDLIWVMRFQSP